jgi:hypothetical protein
MTQEERKGGRVQDGTGEVIWFAGRGACDTSQLPVGLLVDFDVTPKSFRSSALPVPSGMAQGSIILSDHDHGVVPCTCTATITGPITSTATITSTPPSAPRSLPGQEAVATLPGAQLGDKM